MLTSIRAGWSPKIPGCRATYGLSITTTANSPTRIFSTPSAISKIARTSDPSPTSVATWHSAGVGASASVKPLPNKALSSASPVCCGVSTSARLWTRTAKRFLLTFSITRTSSLAIVLPFVTFFLWRFPTAMALTCGRNLSNVGSLQGVQTFVVRSRGRGRERSRTLLFTMARPSIAWARTIMNKSSERFLRRCHDAVAGPIRCSHRKEFGS